MGQSWSGLRKELEEDLICDCLKGRVRYFLTHYHKAPDDHGRVAVRVDGREVLHGNPYSFYIKYSGLERELKTAFGVPPREWDGKQMLHEDENRAVEAAVEDIAIGEGVFEIYHFTEAIREYKNQPVQKSLASENPLVRMFAVMDRRVGKRTLKRLASQVKDQPEWLQFFYKLRLEAENIDKETAYEKA
ncbi:MAG TPA: hypothetical protein PKO35_02130 [Candidatus Atribacteria bacterium]|nr:hypothetical protein [Candidatus Atribacteria bacterium]